MAGLGGGVLGAAATAAALMSERDPWGAPGEAAPGDLLERIAAVDGGGSGGDRRALGQVRRVRDQLRRLAARLQPAEGDRGCSLLDALVAGFPERVGLHTAEGRARLSSGLELRVGRPPLPGEPPAFLAVAVRATSRGVTLSCGAPLEPGSLRVPWRVAVRWDPDAQRVRVLRERRLGALCFETRPPRAADRREQAAAVEALLVAEALRAGPEQVLRPSPAVRSLLARIALLARLRPQLELPDLRFSTVLPMLATGCRSFAALAERDLAGALVGLLGHALHQRLLRELPERLDVPSGSSLRLDYGDGSGPPVLAARIQQLFGMLETPRILGEPIVVKLLAPNQRPAQVTQDLAGFWRGSYQQVRKELRGRYPKHAWPEDPLTAVAENRPRRKR